MNIEHLQGLLERMEAGEDLKYDDFGMALGRADWAILAVSGYFGDTNHAIRFCQNALPGWWFRIATCHLSDDACVCPDFNCPTHGERLRSSLDESADWASLTDVDLRPSGNPARALVMATVKGLIAKGGGGMTYTPTPAQTEALKNGATQLRVALDRQPGKHFFSLVSVNDRDARFVAPAMGCVVDVRIRLPLAPGDTFPVGDKAATVTAVRVERCEGEWMAVATVEMKGGAG